jgi:hypothetical protein
VKLSLCVAHAYPSIAPRIEPDRTAERLTLAVLTLLPSMLVAAKRAA